MRYTWDDFWAFIIGAGVIYVFFVMLDLITGSGFRVWFFFAFWDFMFLVILFIRWMTK
jgi:hypothetical protein